MSRSRILFFLSGSIAAFKACQVISRLVQDGNEVQTIATPGALKFIGAATLEGLTGKPVLSDLWENGRAMEHIHLSRWADFGVLCPASANTVAKLAHGMADDLACALALGWPKGKPFHVFPAMNTEMLSNAATQANLRVLSERGFRVHGTQSGNLACGEEGAGRLLEPERILELLKTPARGKILITSGATREPIDGIRFISNVSTGQTGATLADRLSASGWDVTYLHGEGAMRPKSPVNVRAFGDFQSLDEALREELQKNSYRAVVHAAAVSDYGIDKVNGASPREGAKLANVKLSSEDGLAIELKKNHKILPRLKEYSKNKEIKVIGFKLTLNSDEDETARIARELLKGGVDAVVANDWSKVRADRAKHPGELVTARARLGFTDLDELARELHILIANKELNHGSLS